MQQHRWNEASNHNQSSDNTRAISNPDAVEHGREPKTAISMITFKD